MGFGDSFANVYNAVSGARQRDEALQVQKKSNELEQTFRVLGAVQANNERLDRIQADRDALLQSHAQMFTNMQAAQMQMSRAKDISPEDYASAQLIFNAAADGYKRVTDRLEYLTSAQDRIRNDGDQLSSFLNRFSVISDIPSVQQSIQQVNQQSQQSPVPVGMQAVQAISKPQQGGQAYPQAYPTQFDAAPQGAAPQVQAAQQPNIPGVTGQPAAPQAGPATPAAAQAGAPNSRDEAVLNLIKKSIPYPAELGPNGGVVIKAKTAIEAEDARKKLADLQTGLQFSSPLPVTVEDPQSELAAKTQLDAAQNKLAGEAATREVSPSNSALNKVGIVLSKDENGGPRFTDPAGNAPSFINTIKLEQDRAEEDDEEDRAGIAPEGANQRDAAVAMKLIARSASENPAVAQAAVRDLGMSIEAYARDLASHGDLTVDRGGGVGVTALGIPFASGKDKPNSYVVNLFGTDPESATEFAMSITSLTRDSGTGPGEALPSLRLPTAEEAVFQWRVPVGRGERPLKNEAISVKDGVSSDERKLIGYLSSLAGDDGYLDEATSRKVVELARLSKRVPKAWKSVIHPKVMKEIVGDVGSGSAEAPTPQIPKSGILHNFPYQFQQPSSGGRR